MSLSAKLQIVLSNRQKVHKGSFSLQIASTRGNKSMINVWLCLGTRSTGLG